MPVIFKGNQRIEYIEEGAGETVVLVHSSVSGNRQWRSLIESLKERYRVIAPNLFGYGETSPWSGTAAQTLAAQAELVVAICEESEGPVHLVGHSFGGAVAFKAASLLGSRVRKLILFEPTLFYLLSQHGRYDAFHEAKAISDHVKRFAAVGDWPAAAVRFADYWMGDGAWAQMPEKRQSVFASALRSSVYEFDAILEEPSTVELCTSLFAKTMVISDAGSPRSVLEIVEILENACPHWNFRQIAGCGHMAPLTRPDVVDPMIAEFLGP